MLTIESAQNDTFKKYLSLTTAKGLKKEGVFLLSGDRLVREFLARPPASVVHELLAPGAAALTTAPVITFTRELFDQIDVLGTHASILVVELPPIESLSVEQLNAYEPKDVELVAPIGDPGNLGALLRSCEAFGMKNVILTQEAAHPFLPKSVKASAGSVLRLNLRRGPSLAAFPAASIALDAAGTSIDDFVWPATGFLAVGEEGAGLGAAADRFQNRVRIPTEGVESLNAVVAASIALLALRKSRQAG